MAVCAQDMGPLDLDCKGALSKFERDFPRSELTLMLHYTLHLPEQNLFGPARNINLFGFESYNGVLKQLAARNRACPETTIMAQYSAGGEGAAGGGQHTAAAAAAGDAGDGRGTAAVRRAAGARAESARAGRRARLDGRGQQRGLRRPAEVCA